MPKGRVLIIEDSAETQQLLAELVLEPNGYRPLTAIDGEEGLRLAQEELPDLIILDMQLPKMTGLEVLQALHERHLDIPVIFTTVRESAELVVQAFRLGARDYVIKPFGPLEMQAAIERIMTADRLREQQGQLTHQLLEANQKLQRQLQELSAVHAIGRSITSLLDLSGVLRRTVEAAVYVADAEEGMLMLLGEQEKKLHLRAVKRPDDKEARELRAPVAEGPGYDALHAPRHILLTGDQALGPTGRKFKALLHLPLRVADRRVIGVLGVANQETERVFSERDISLLSALADSVAVAIENARLVAQNEARRIRQASLLQNAQDAIILTDEHGRILTCNEATGKILDSDPEAVKLRSATKALPHPVLREMFAQVKESGQQLRNELLLEDGQTFNAQLTPVEGVGFILVMQDITHLKELDELKSGFVFALTHDLRTPLTTTQGYLDLLPKAGPVNEEQHSFIGYAQEGIHTITKLLDEVMEIGSIEAGARVEMIPCDLREVITSVVEDLRPRASEKRQELRWNPPDALPLVKGNRGHLCQAMSHLVNNAIKYTPRDGHIVIEVGEDEGYAVVRVSDDGIGIPLAHQTRIFDQFYRIDSAETIGIKGMGLGLAIVKVIIENHNGRVWVDSKPGMGSTFSFVLPALPEAPGRPEIYDEDSPPA